MPTAPPSSRTVSLSAEATPCLLGRQRLGDRRRRRAHGEADADGQDQQAGQHRPVAAVGRHHDGQQRQPGGEQAEAGEQHVARSPTRLGDRRRDRRQRHHHDHHRQQRPPRPRAPSSRARPAGTATSTRKMPNITANTISSVSEPAARPRLRNRRMSSSGCVLAQLPDDEGEQGHDAERSGRPGSAGRSSPSRGPRGCRARGRRWRRADRTEPTVSKRPGRGAHGSCRPTRSVITQRDAGERRPAWRTATAR